MHRFAGRASVQEAELSVSGSVIRRRVAIVKCNLANTYREFEEATDAARRILWV